MTKTLYWQARWLEVRDKEFYYIVTAADGEIEAAATTIGCFRGYADCVAGGQGDGNRLRHGGL